MIIANKTDAVGLQLASDSRSGILADQIFRRNSLFPVGQPAEHQNFKMHTSNIATEQPPTSFCNNGNSMPHSTLLGALLSDSIESTLTEFTNDFGKQTGNQFAAATFHLPQFNVASTEHRFAFTNFAPFSVTGQNSFYTNASAQTPSENQMAAESLVCASSIDYSRHVSQSSTADSASTLTVEEEHALLADLQAFLDSDGYKNVAVDNICSIAADNTRANESALISSASSTVSSGLSSNSSTSSAATSAQSLSGGKRRGRKRCVSPSTRRERKRQQNREAAQRYRDRRNDQMDTLDQQLEKEQSRKRELLDSLRRAESERRLLLRFAEKFNVKQMMMSQNHDSSIAESLNLLEKLISRKLEMPSLSSLLNANSSNSAMITAPICSRLLMQAGSSPQSSELVKNSSEMAELPGDSLLNFTDSANYELMHTTMPAKQMRL